MELFLLLLFLFSGVIIQNEYQFKQSFKYIIKKYLKNVYTYFFIFGVYLCFRYMTNNAIIIDILNGIFFGVILIFIENIIKFNDDDIYQFTYELYKNESENILYKFNKNIPLFMLCVDTICLKFNIKEHNIHDIKNYLECIEKEFDKISLHKSTKSFINGCLEEILKNYKDEKDI